MLAVFRCQTYNFWTIRSSLIITVESKYSNIDMRYYTVPYIEIVNNANWWELSFPILKMEGNRENKWFEKFQSNSDFIGEDILPTLMRRIAWLNSAFFQWFSNLRRYEIWAEEEVFFIILIYVYRIWRWEFWASQLNFCCWKKLCYFLGFVFNVTV